MEPLRFDSLNEQEKETLRALRHHGSNKAVAQALEINLETVRARLRSARQKLGIGDSKTAAVRLAEFEQTSPKPGASIWGIPPASFVPELDRANAETPVVREMPSTWSGAEAEVLPEGRPKRGSTGDILRLIAHIVVAIAAAVALIVYGMRETPDRIEWDTFQWFT